MNEQTGLAGMALTRNNEKVQEHQRDAQTLAEATRLSYHETSHQPVRDVDLISQLRNNIHHLERLQSHMSFVVREIRGLVAKG